VVFFFKEKKLIITKYLVTFAAQKLSNNTSDQALTGNLIQTQLGEMQVAADVG